MRLNRQDAAMIEMFGEQIKDAIDTRMARTTDPMEKRIAILEAQVQMLTAMLSRPAPAVDRFAPPFVVTCSTEAKT